MNAKDMTAKLRLINRADRLWKRAAEAWEKTQRSEDAAPFREKAEAVIRRLSPRIVVDYPGLYPTFKVDGKDCYGLYGAYKSTLSDGDARAFGAFYTLRGFLRRGARIGLVHFGDRGRVRLLTTARDTGGKPRIVDLTYWAAHAFGNRYNDKTRTVSVNYGDDFVNHIAIQLFNDPNALRVEWL